MKIYDVEVEMLHTFRQVELTKHNIVASSQNEAINKAKKRAELEAVIDSDESLYDGSDFNGATVISVKQVTQSYRCKNTTDMFNEK